MANHRGPVCRECRREYYYDYLDKPSAHEGSGLCWECWSDRQIERAHKLCDSVEAKSEVGG